jgi:hypothetical protein
MVPVPATKLPVMPSWLVKARRSVPFWYPAPMVMVAPVSVALSGSETVIVEVTAVAAVPLV